MASHSRTFHLYLGLHSLLIGIFPFFIPVYLWNEGYGLGAVSLFIAIAGLGFCLGLWAWDRLRARLNLTYLIALSLLLEILVLLNIYLLDMKIAQPTPLSLALCYGAYNCFFWTTQRALFFEIIKPTNSGRKYGNFQIFVGVSLQVGILLGGLLLETADFIYIVALSTGIALIGFFILSRTQPAYPSALRRAPALTLREIFTFRDKYASRTIFIVDGAFLFLESFFWVISLFLIGHESFAKLGALVLSLAAICFVLFFLFKNTLDRLDQQRAFQAGVWLYALSWLLRVFADERAPLILLFLVWVLITFGTVMFRLVFNKRFYDLAKRTSGHRYLVLKSYYSQAAIGVLFFVFGGGVMLLGADAKNLADVYWAATGAAFLYLLYGRR